MRVQNFWERLCVRDDRSLSTHSLATSRDSVAEMSRSKAVGLDAPEDSPEPQWEIDMDGEEESDVDVRLDVESDKSEAEEELERLVFGDAAGFRQNLKELARGNVDDEVFAEGTTGLEGLDDADVGQTLGKAESTRHLTDMRIAVHYRP